MDIMVSYKRVDELWRKCATGIQIAQTLHTEGLKNPYAIALALSNLRFVVYPIEVEGGIQLHVSNNPVDHPGHWLKNNNPRHLPSVTLSAKVEEGDSHESTTCGCANTGKAQKDGASIAAMLMSEGRPLREIERVLEYYGFDPRLVHEIQSLRQ